MSETTAMAVAALRVAYPRQDFPDDSVRLYVRMLADLDAPTVSRAVERLIRRSTWLPSVAEIRLETAEEICPLPTAEEAWTIATTTPVSMGDSSHEAVAAWAAVALTVRETINAMGGLWSIRRSENPTTLRAQFLRDYEQRRATAMQEAVGARAPRPELTRAEQAFGALGTATTSGVLAATIEETDSMRPRPVWARWLRRHASLAEGGLIDPWPTDEEKHDAILVLRDTGQGRPTVMPGDPLHVEAQRIMDEASAQ